jgi:YbgC/YbaW family acyl-CoA thioester hydrolase
MSRPDRQHRDSYHAIRPITTRWMDNDVYAHVNNVVYLRWVQDAAVAHWTAVATETEQRSYLWVVVRHEIDYKRPATLGDALLLHGRLDEVQRARFWCAFEVRRESDDTLLVTARQCLALVQMPEGKPVRLPADWL